MSEYVFISYKFEQKDTALKIKQILESNGIQCWMAPESIPGGSSYASEITSAINGCKDFVIILSALAQESQYIQKELDSAIKRRKTVLPFMIDDFTLNPSFDYYLTDVQRYFAYKSWEDALEKLIREIRFSFDSIDSSPSPESIYRDPIIIGARLPHILENGFLLFNRYKIIENLGIYRGGIQHYRALDTHTEMEVLVMYVDLTIPQKDKPHIGISFSGTFFQHPYISSPIDEYSNESYYVRIEPFYEVDSLAHIIHETGPQSYIQVVKWASAVCHAMIYLNEEKGYIYGQMTPVNIRIKKDGLPLLFDLSCATRIGQNYKGSFDFSFVPVEAYNKPATPWIDIFSLGVNMYYALTGKSQFDNHMVFSVKDNDLPDNVPNDLVTIINKCSDIRYKERYNNFKDVLSDLEAVGIKQNKESLFTKIKRLVTGHN